ncbi:ubiquitin-conjugating enzyme E2 4, partial [Tanacetum coccineum]
SGDVCVNVLNGGWNPMTDLANVLEHYLPMLLKEPNVDDPLNEDAADLLLTDRPDYEAKVKGSLKDEEIVSRNDHSMYMLPTSESIGKQRTMHKSQHDTSMSSPCGN